MCSIQRSMLIHFTLEVKPDASLANILSLLQPCWSYFSWQIPSTESLLSWNIEIMMGRIGNLVKCLLYIKPRSLVSWSTPLPGYCGAYIHHCLLGIKDCNGIRSGRSSTTLASISLKAPFRAGLACSTVACNLASARQSWESCCMSSEFESSLLLITNHSLHLRYWTYIFGRSFDLVHVMRSSCCLWMLQGNVFAIHHNCVNNSWLKRFCSVS